MDLHVRRNGEGHWLHGGGGDVDLVNRYLAHLAARGFSQATVRAYAFDVLNFLRFCAQCRLGLATVAPGDLFDYLDWQARRTSTAAAQTVVRIDRRGGTAAATMNRRIAAVRGMFEYLLVVGERGDSSRLMRGGSRRDNLPTSAARGPTCLSRLPQFVATQC